MFKTNCHGKVLARRLRFMRRCWIGSKTSADLSRIPISQIELDMQTTGQMRAGALDAEALIRFSDCALVQSTISV